MLLLIYMYSAILIYVQPQTAAAFIPQVSTLTYTWTMLCWAQFLCAGVARTIGFLPLPLFGLQAFEHRAFDNPPSCADGNGRAKEKPGVSQRA